jgi:hypothetical protein
MNNFKISVHNFCQKPEKLKYRINALDEKTN